MRRYAIIFTALTAVLGMFVVAAVALGYPPASLTSTQTSITVNGLDCNTNYEVRVREWRSGAWRDSNTYTKSTTACANPTPTPTPSPTPTPTATPTPPQDTPADAVWTPPTGAVAGTPVTLNGTTSTGDAPVACQWNWDEPNGGDTSLIGTGCTRQHTFGSAGTKYLKLTVTDADGDTDTSSQSFQVGAGTPTPTPTPSPTPTTTPSPTPTPTPPPNPGGNNCMPNPSDCGFPDWETTGLSNAAALIPSGSVTLSTPGQVFENRHVTGSITVTAPNVTIRNVKLTATDFYYGIRSFGWQNNTSGLVIDHVDFDLNGHYEIKGVAFDTYTVRNSRFYNGSDCGHFGDGPVLIENNYCALGPDANADGNLESFSCADGPHYDGFQSDGGNQLTIRHNTIKVPCGQTSAILMSTNTSGIRDVQVHDNLMAGGGYTLYCDAGPVLGGVNNFTGNRFARTYFPQSGRWGPTTGCQRYPFTGNVWDDTGAPLAG